MKTKIIITLLFISTINYAQDKLITKTGTVIFEASVPSFEEVKAKSSSTSCILNTKTGEIASLVLMKSFRFKVALMEEHFNENYVESDKYPKATFKGKIEDFDVAKLSITAKNHTIRGILEMHGNSKEITILASIRKEKESIHLHSIFVVNTNDFAIEIPSIVSKKVSKKVSITFDFLLK